MRLGEKIMSNWFIQLRPQYEELCNKRQFGRKYTFILFSKRMFGRIYGYMRNTVMTDRQREDMNSLGELVHYHHINSTLEEYIKGISNSKELQAIEGTPVYDFITDTCIPDAIQYGASRTIGISKSSSSISQMTKATEWEAWTDGASSPNPGPTGAAFILKSNTNFKICKGVYFPEGTSNIGELQAIKLAIEELNSQTAQLQTNFNNATQYNLTIYTDSQYAWGQLTQNWKRKANQELLHEIDNILTQNITITHIRKEQQIKEHELAHKISNIVIRNKSNYYREVS